MPLARELIDTFRDKVVDPEPRLRLAAGEVVADDLDRAESEEIRIATVVAAATLDPRRLKRSSMPRWKTTLAAAVLRMKLTTMPPLPQLRRMGRAPVLLPLLRKTST